MPKTALHVFAHDAESTDEVVGTGGTLKVSGELVAERRWDLAELLALEMGKLRAEAEAEV